jgi:hypothetical protein
MEMPGEWGGRVIAAYGQDLLTDEWKKCGIEVKNFWSTPDGGDQITVRKMFEKLAKDKDAENRTN